MLPPHIGGYRSSHEFATGRGSTVISIGFFTVELPGSFVTVRVTVQVRFFRQAGEGLGSAGVVRDLRSPGSSPADRTR